MAKRQQEVKVECPTGTMLYVWADDDVIEKVKEVEGIYEVGDKFMGHYAAFIDHRYDIKDIAEEIEALV